LAQENQELYAKTHSGKLSKNEMPSSVQQWILVAVQLASMVKRIKKL
jgi:hypothetical protein